MQFSKKVFKISKHVVFNTIFIGGWTARGDKFEKLVGFLYTAQSYLIESEKPLYDAINQAINNLGSVMSSGNDADYYLSHYTKCRLSASDARIKDRLRKKN